MGRLLGGVVRGERPVAQPIARIDHDQGRIGPAKFDPERSRRMVRAVADQLAVHCFRRVEVARRMAVGFEVVTERMAQPGTLERFARVQAQPVSSEPQPNSRFAHR